MGLTLSFSTTTYTSRAQVCCRGLCSTTKMNMEIVELKAKINSLVQSMLIDQILDAQFTRVQALQDETNPYFAIEVMGLFCADLETMIGEFHNYMSPHKVDYEKLRDRAHKLKGSSACIGAHRMKLASVELLQATRDKNMQGCDQAVKRIVTEYFPLRGKFLELLEIQERIVDLETRQREEINNEQEVV